MTSSATAAGASQTVVSLDAVAATLANAADAVQSARRHGQREQANAALSLQRQLVLSALAGRAIVPADASAGLLYVLDQEVQATAVTYSSEQRAVLEGTQSVPEMGPSPRGLTVAPVTLPPLAGSPATIALMTEARTLLAHPYENTWWEPHVRAFAASHRDQLINDIEARNEGVPLCRRAPTP